MSWSGTAVRSSAEPSRLGFRYPSSGSGSKALEELSVTSRSGLTGVIGAVVIVDIPLSFLRHEPQDAQMAVGHDPV